MPLGASADEKRFKAAFLDVGLQQRLCGIAVDHEMQHSDLLAMYRGPLAEQFVAQELFVTHCPQPPQRYDRSFQSLLIFAFAIANC